MPFLRNVAAVAALAISPLSAGHAQEAVSVGVITATKVPISAAATFVGRVKATERVDLRARVTGFLQSVTFNEGDTIQKGDVLYRIEPDLFNAAVQSARGDLLKSQAVYANADLALKRAEDLVRTNATPIATRDQRAAEQKSAQGDIVSADAALRRAETNLGYTTIAAPITGRIGRTSVTPGNVVGPDSGVLATIVKTDPMYVLFPVSEQQFLEVKRSQQTDPASLVVRLRFADGSVYDQTGTIDFVDVTVDKATDTITVRAVFPNPKGLLVDGAYAQVSVESGKPKEQVVVPQSALLIDQQGPYVFVAQDGKATVRRIRPDGEHGRDIVVASGVDPGDLVITSGLQSLRPGAPVSASPPSAASSSSSGL